MEGGGIGVGDGRVVHRRFSFSIVAAAHFREVENCSPEVGGRGRGRGH